MGLGRTDDPAGAAGGEDEGQTGRAIGRAREAIHSGLYGCGMLAAVFLVILGVGGRPVWAA